MTEKGTVHKFRASQQSGSTHIRNNQLKTEILHIENCLLTHVAFIIPCGQHSTMTTDT